MIVVLRVNDLVDASTVLLEYYIGNEKKIFGNKKD
jgi:hypothetical protein